jgi:hypothetical protein
MLKLSLEKLKPGMRLAEDISSNGNVLLPKNTKLTDRHLQIFESLGIDTVTVNDNKNNDDKKTKVDVSDTIKAEAKTAVAPAFQLANTDFPPMQVLYKIAVKRKIRKLL